MDLSTSKALLTEYENEPRKPGIGEKLESLAPRKSETMAPRKQGTMSTDEGDWRKLMVEIEQRLTLLLGYAPTEQMQAFSQITSVD